MKHTLTIITFTAVLLSGCKKETVVEYPVWSDVKPGTKADAVPGSGYETYLKAAKLVMNEPKCEAMLTRTTFYPDQQTAAIDLTRESRNLIRSVSSRGFQFTYSPPGLQPESNVNKSWRLIGRTMAWQITNSVTKKEFGPAIQTYLDAQRFGFLLTGGGATEVSLGLSIVDEARRALLPGLNLMGAGQLKQLSDGILAGLETKPPIGLAIKNEADNAKLTLQTIQEAFKRDELGNLEKQLGAGFEEDIRQLGLLKEKRADAIELFKSIGEQIRSQEELVDSNSRKPASRRTSQEKKTSRKFRLLRRAVLGTLEPILNLNDVTLARTRLLCLHARLLQRIKSGQPLPKNLDGQPTLVSQDPYTGFAFSYRGEGRQFLLYSAGADGKDDGGETDTAFLAPDLKLERPD